jgi:hypothetical protein
MTIGRCRRVVGRRERPQLGVLGVVPDARLRTVHSSAACAAGGRAGARRRRMGAPRHRTVRAPARRALSWSRAVRPSALLGGLSGALSYRIITFCVTLTSAGRRPSLATRAATRGSLWRSQALTCGTAPSPRVGDLDRRRAAGPHRCADASSAQSRGEMMRTYTPPPPCRSASEMSEPMQLAWC